MDFHRHRCIVLSSGNWNIVQRKIFKRFDNWKISGLGHPKKCNISPFSALVSEASDANKISCWSFFVERFCYQVHHAHIIPLCSFQFGLFPWNKNYLVFRARKHLLEHQVQASWLQEVFMKDVGQRCLIS